MTNKDVFDTALRQSAIDMGCAASDFLKSENVIVESRKNPLARRYLDLPLACGLVTYGANIVASIDMRRRDIVEDYITRYPSAHAFETPNMHVLDDAFRVHGYRVCFMAEYFLPDVDAIPDLPCPYETRILDSRDFSDLYLPKWSNALCEKRRELDVLGVGAYDSGRLVALAGCSRDCEDMWQIGVDVLPEARRRGVASALTSKLAREIIARGKVPFYCCAWSNIASARNAIKSGFRPAWAELTVKPAEYVDKMNGI